MKLLFLYFFSQLFLSVNNPSVFAVVVLRLLTPA